MLAKSQIFETIEQLPESVSLDELIFIEKVNIGLAQSENGMVSSESEARRKLSKWLKIKCDW